MSSPTVIAIPPSFVGNDEKNPLEIGGGLRARFFASTPAGQVLHSSRRSEPHTDETPSRPSIAFQPSLPDYQARSARLALQRAASGMPTPSLPEGFPERIDGPRAWSGRDITDLERFTIRLSPTDVAEIETALTHFKSLPGDNEPEHVTAELFPLPTLGSRLVEVSKELHDGCGMAILKGLDPARYSAWENAVLFAGLTAYIGEERGCQDRYGNMLTHLVDMAFKFGCASKRSPTFTANALPYHNDVCDILCLYVQDTADNGGESILSSSAAIYNEIASTRPDVIRTLADPCWVYDKDKPPNIWPTRSVLFPEPAKGPFFCFSRQKITGSEFYPLSPTIPPMTEAQAEALDMVHFVGEKHGLTMKLESGDMLLYNNLALLHGRNAFTDRPLDGHKRHILRLWVRNSDMAWKTPEGLKRDWFLVYGDSERRGRAHWRIRAEDTDKDRVIGHKLTCS